MHVGWINFGVILGFIMGVCFIFVVILFLHSCGKVSFGKKAEVQTPKVGYRLRYCCQDFPDLHRFTDKFNAKNMRVAVRVPMVDDEIQITNKGRMRHRFVFLRVTEIDWTEDQYAPLITLTSPGRNLFNVLKYGSWHMEWSEFNLKIRE